MAIFISLFANTHILYTFNYITRPNFPEGLQIKILLENDHEVIGLISQPHQNIIK